MTGSDMLELIEYHYDEIVADYIYPKNAKDNPEVEDIDYMEDEKFQEYAMEWVQDHKGDQDEMAYDAWKEDGDR